MGIIFSNAVLLAQARQAGVRFDRTLTIGHLNQYLSQQQIQRLADRFGAHLDSRELATQVYVEKLFQQLLGAHQISSLDCSEFEQCDIVHDLNYPVESIWRQQFDVVIDGGSLEHVFNFPVAIANCMNMVKPGGSLFVFTMANNHMGHGFYQFSPELFYRILHPDNGFQIKNLILEQHDYPGAELSAHTRCFSVVDPAKVGTRVGLVSKSPVMMMAHAVRTEIKPIFSQYPIQSDYSARHSGQSKLAESREGPGRMERARNLARKILKRLPAVFKNTLDGYRQLWQYSFANRRFYQRWPTE